MSQASFGGSDIKHSTMGDDERIGVLQSTFPAETNNLISLLAADEDLSPAAILLAVFQETLRRYTGQQCISVSFQNGLNLPETVTFERGLSVRQAVEGLQQQSGTGQACDAQFCFEKDPAAIPPAPLTTPLLCSVRYCGDQVSVWLQYERKTWSSTIADGFVASFQKLLFEAVSNPDSPLEELEILTQSDLQQFADWNATGRPYPQLRTDQLFDLQAAKSPLQPAVTFEGETLSYASLQARSNNLAARLSSLGVGPGVLVGICTERSLDMVVAMLATFKAGGAYLPLDPDFPADRLAFMLEDARPLVVITKNHLLEALPLKATHLICLDAPPSDGFQQPIPPSPDSDLDQLAYLLYTSGSTGKPKGVQIGHRGLTNLLDDVISKVDLTSTDVLLATSTISFDVSIFEIFAPLITGAHLVVAPRTTAVNGESLSAALRQSGATVLQATPSGWRILLESGWTGHPGLKMLTAGEPLDRTLANRLLDRGAGLWNLYGPTEATVYATGTQITRDQTRITVGKPLANYTTYILDGNLTQVPVGAIGELYLGGIGLSIGYLNRTDLTAERFVPDPFSSIEGMRLYRTGDLARFLPSGEIEVLGRIDNQIKLRGYRIELEEVESLLDSHPSVMKAVARVVSLGDDDQRLIAYIAPRVAGSLDEKSLREYASRKLPWYMVPTSFVLVRAFALTPGGKVDRKALPVPGDLFLKSDQVPHRRRATLEDTVLDCWRSVLSLPHLTLDDNFFEVGGHSLLAARMITEIGTRLDCKVPVSCLIEAPTARAFTDRLVNADNSAPRCIVKMQPRGTLPPIYMVHHLLGDILVYRAMADCFAPDRQVYGIQAPADFVLRNHPYSLVSLASEYIKEILQQQSSGPFHLAGYSSGSVLVFEMARQLKEAGHEIGLLALVDGDIKTPGPAMSLPLKYWKIFVRKLCKIVFKFRDELSEGPKLFVMKRLGYVLFLWRMRNLQKSATPPDSSELTLEEALLLCENAYRPQPYSGSALLLRFHDEAWRYGPTPLMGWEGLVQGGIDAIDVPGGHMTGMTPEGAPFLAKVLKSHIDLYELNSAKL